MWTSGWVSTSDAVQVGRQQWRMARAQLSHRDALISGPVTRPAAVRMLHAGKYSVDTRVWIAVIPCGGDGVLVGNECCRCRLTCCFSRLLQVRWAPNLRTYGHYSSMFCRQLIASKHWWHFTHTSIMIYYYYKYNTRMIRAITNNGTKSPVSIGFVFPSAFSLKSLCWPTERWMAVHLRVCHPTSPASPTFHLDRDYNHLRLINW